MTFRVEHSLEVTVHIVFKHLSIELVQTHKRVLYIWISQWNVENAEIQCDRGFFVYVNTEWYITLYNDCLEWVSIAPKHERYMFQILKQYNIYAVFIISTIDVTYVISDLKTCNFCMQDFPE